VSQGKHTLCHLQHNITSYPAFIFYPPLHQQEYGADNLQFYEFLYDIKPYVSHFRVLKQFAIDSQMTPEEFSKDMGYLEKMFSF